MEETQRLFVAVPLPTELLGVVERAQRSLAEVPGVRLLRPEQLHVTIAFIGEVGVDKAEVARRVVEQVPSGLGGEATVARLLPLPLAAKARVITLELDDEDRVFGRLFEDVMQGLEAGEVMRREERPFRPHLTIARMRPPGPVRPKYESERASFAVESVCLYRSDLRREGAVYTVVARTVFQRSGAEESA